MEHQHPHTHDTPTDLQEIKAMLRFMISHNAHHADELAELLPLLPQNAAKRLLSAIGSFEVGNVELKEALSMLEPSAEELL